ncbi:MAG: hypothetical protein P4M09_06085 [Devosia sp.]|nr:hypothetical protein [Devosia sp.]
MKKTIALVAVVAMLTSAAPAEAAGCLKGAIVGGIVGHFTHHTLLGALGGCVIGHVAGNSDSTSLTYADIGTMLGAGSTEPDWSRVVAASKVNVVRVSSLKGYVAHDTKMQAAIQASAAVRSLDSKIAANTKLTSKLRGAGDAPSDVIAAAVDDAGIAYLFVDK